MKNIVWYTKIPYNLITFPAAVFNVNDHVYKVEKWKSNIFHQIFWKFYRLKPKPVFAGFSTLFNNAMPIQARMEH